MILVVDYFVNMYYRDKKELEPRNLCQIYVFSTVHPRNVRWASTVRHVFWTRYRTHHSIPREEERREPRCHSGRSALSWCRRWILWIKERGLLFAQNTLFEYRYLYAVNMRVLVNDSPSGRPFRTLIRKSEFAQRSMHQQIWWYVLVDSNTVPSRKIEMALLAPTEL